MRSAAALMICVGIAPAFIAGSQLPVKVYTTADGLADNRINKIVRDSRGYLWFCTDEGLSRFDGYSFTNYGPLQGLPPRSVTDLVETRAGEYWLATTGGLVRFDPESADHKFRLFLPGDDEASGRINAVIEDRAGALWLGTYSGLYRFDRSSETFRRMEVGMPDRGLEARRVNALLEDRQGALWAGTEMGLYRVLPNGASERFTTDDGLPSNMVRTLLSDHLGRLWVGTFAGLCRLTPHPAAGGWMIEHTYTGADGLATDHAMSLLESSAGKLWVGTFGGLSELSLRPLQDSLPVKTYTKANGMISLEMNSLAEDCNRNLWIGSAEGAMKITEADFSTFTGADGLTAELYAPSSVRVSSIFADRSGVLHVTTAGTGRKPFLSRLDGETFTSIFPNLPGDVTDIGWGTHQIALQDHTGDWWIATTKGLARFGAPARFEQLARMPVKAVYTTADGLPTNEIFRIFEDSRGDIWVACATRGIARWDRRTASFHRYPGFDDVRFGKFISAFAEDRDGDVWMGMFGGGVARFRSGRFAYFGETDGIGAGGVRDLYCDRADRVWIATTRGGVTRVDSPESDRPRFTTIGVSQGLSSALAECVTEDRWGRIYICGGRGIDRLDPARRNGGAVTKHFTTSDGLAGGNLQAAFADGDGNLWFGTTLGLSRLVPQPDPPPSPPGILISALRIRGVPYPMSDLGVAQLAGIQLKSAQAQIEVSFLSLSFEAGEVLRYQFMLAGADRDWSSLTTRRTVNYASLKPGSYRFLVRAVNSAGVTGPAPASIAFTVLPPLWQRWWFLMLGACMGILLLYALHRDRVDRLVQLERVRTRIATDLHDDIGASLSQIAVVSEVLSRRGEAEDRARESLSQIAADARELVTSMSDLVWSIDPRRDHLQDLIQRMRRFSSEMFTARNIHFRLSAPAGDLHLNADQRRHIFLIFKEAVNNIVRHADCSEAEVSLALDSNHLLFRVHDNGPGLDVSHATSGNGLSSMTARAEAIGGKVEIAASPGLGTTVALKVPLSGMPSPSWRAFFHLHRG